MHTAVVAWSAHNSTRRTVHHVIGYLSGVVRGQGREVCIVVNGVGYVVNVVPDINEGDQVDLVITTIVRENAILLYGFAGEDEQAAFAALIAVHGVGPAVALNILRGLGVLGLVEAVDEKNTKALVKVPGVGKKTAETIVSLAKLDNIVAEKREPAALSVRSVIEALVHLGYDQVRSDQVVRELYQTGTQDESTLLRDALAQLR